MNKEFLKTQSGQSMEGPLVIKSDFFEDQRGLFYESWNSKIFNDLVLEKVNFVQDNISFSKKGVLRGLHYQLPPFAQTKLIRVIEGSVLDVAVDVRKGSPSFGKHVAIELTSENKKQFLIPKGFAHGFVVLSNTAVLSYKVDNYYNAASERGIAFDDSIINVDWRVEKHKLKLSMKDTKHPSLENAECFKYEMNLNV